MSYKRADIEVLAPAGNLEIMKAVVRAGADAVYLGGNMFGARAFAGNLEENELLEAIEYAHIFGRKVYLTVNTLLKQTEIEQSLVRYIMPYYKAGLDAVIVQDLGVFNLIRKHFPDMDIHASTQMTQTGPLGSQILKDMGASRVVTSREMSLKEIKTIKENVNIEIESFVHGALCYCYSGQCLMSSFNGGRSGNRGRCAQPCRMAYTVSDSKGKIISDKKEPFVLSPKDMCALEILPDVIEAGVYSLKIEGRMKNVTYAAKVTSLYRKYVDMYIDKGRNGYSVSKQDMMDLMDIYNRGAFTTGYYNSSKGKNMISLTRPNHMGLPALKVSKNHSGEITFDTLVDINKGDVFEIDKEHSFESGQNLSKNQKLIVNLPKKYNLHTGRIINRMNNGLIKNQVISEYVDKELKLSVDMKLTAKIDSPLELKVTYGDITVSKIGNIVTKAMNQPATKENLLKNIGKTGDTFFVLGEADIDMSDNIFVSVGEIKELRRNALIELEQKLRTRNQREYLPQNTLLSDISRYEYGVVKNYVYINNKATIEWLNSENVSALILDFEMIEKGMLSQEEINLLKKSYTVYAGLPHILTVENYSRFDSLINDCRKLEISNYFVRNIEEIGRINMLYKDRDFDIHIITDSSLYVFNNYAKEELKGIIDKNSLILDTMVLPLELTDKELKTVAKKDTSILVYGRAPLMISKQCVKKTLGLCDKTESEVILTGTKNKQYAVRSVCSYCYSHLKSSIINLNKEDLSEFDSVSKFYFFENENKEVVNNIINGTFGEGDTGHFKSPVD